MEWKEIDTDVDALKIDNRELTKELYSSYKKILDLNKQVEYLTTKLETMETQLELFSKDKLK
tara:strand:- start:571 stop:756 length:186 start_codon:yes stop_codon:yes gene_type:complete